MEVEAPSSPVELLTLPEELVQCVLHACDAITLLRMMRCCGTLRRLTTSESLWEAKLAELWRDKCDPARSTRQR